MERCFYAVASALLVLSFGSVLEAGPAEDLLPDIITPRTYLFDRELIPAEPLVPGGPLRKLLRLSNGTANIGRGPLRLAGQPPNPDGSQSVLQTVFRADGSSWTREAGRFVFHDEHDHVHIENWASYRLREFLPGGGIGDVVAEGEKTSFCILDLDVFDPTLPGFRPAGLFNECGALVQGLSVGWVDIYDRRLPGQNIDVSDVPDGRYWLESEVDPADHILESNEDNNATQILVQIGDPIGIPLDAYEPNGSADDVRELIPGAVNSPNLGPCDRRCILRDMTLHASGNVDVYRFYVNHTGSARDFVLLSFQFEQGILGMDLLDDAGNIVDRAFPGFENPNSVRIPLIGREEGWYFVRVFGVDGDISPRYTLVIDPPQNEAPRISVVAPPAGDQPVSHGLENYDVRWAASDPENDEMWVRVYLNHAPELNGEEFLLARGLNVPASTGFMRINSAEVDPGTYWVYCEVTDGGQTVGAWSEGTVSFLESALFQRGDSNSDGRLDISDAVNVLGFLFSGSPESLDCEKSADIDDDGAVNIADALTLLNLLFSGTGGPLPAPECVRDLTVDGLSCVSYPLCEGHDDKG